VLTGHGKDFQEVFLSRGLEDEIGQAFEHEIANEGWEVYIEVLTVILELLGIFDDSEV
jgi:hypothetical protein